MKVVSIVFGILLLAGGIYCLFAPVTAYSAISWLVGIAMLVEGIGSVISWNDRRRFGFADGWTLLGAIVSIILGCFLLFSFVAQYAVDLIIAYIIAAWLVFGGVTRIAAALRLRSFASTMSGGLVDASWGGLFLLGVVVTILGVLCFFNPLALMASVGALLGITIICLGAGFLVHGLRTQD